MIDWRSIALQVPAYVAFAAFVGYFSAAPEYRHLEPERAVVKLSFRHAGAQKVECRERSEAELAKLAPNMRAKMDCPRERSDVKVEIEMDGKLLYRIVAPPTGIRSDLPSTVYRRLEIPAGTHSFKARLADGPGGEFRHQAATTVTLAAGRVLVIDFVASSGGFQFRS